jgi:hypothetical protein
MEYPPLALSCGLIVVTGVATPTTVSGTRDSPPSLTNPTMKGIAIAENWRKLSDKHEIVQWQLE